MTVEWFDRTTGKSAPLTTAMLREQIEELTNPESDYNRRRMERYIRAERAYRSVVSRIPKGMESDPDINRALAYISVAEPMHPNVWKACEDKLMRDPREHD